MFLSQSFCLSKRFILQSEARKVWKIDGAEVQPDEDMGFLGIPSAQPD